MPEFEQTFSSTKIKRNGFDLDVAQNTIDIEGKTYNLAPMQTDAIGLMSRPGLGHSNLVDDFDEHLDHPITSTHAGFLVSSIRKRIPELDLRTFKNVGYIILGSKSY